MRTVIQSRKGEGEEGQAKLIFNGRGQNEWFEKPLYCRELSWQLATSYYEHPGFMNCYKSQSSTNTLVAYWWISK